MPIGHHTQVDPPVGSGGYETAVTDVTDLPTDLQKGRKKKHKKLFCWRAVLLDHETSFGPKNKASIGGTLGFQLAK